jgi:hypothetical protein
MHDPDLAAFNAVVGGVWIARDAEYTDVELVAMPPKQRKISEQLDSRANRVLDIECSRRIFSRT